MLVALAFMIAGGLSVIARYTGGLGAVTNLNNSNPWGMWIGFDVLSGVALAAGGFVIAATVHIFRLERYHALVRPAILTAFLGYLAVILGLLVDLGRPWNAPWPSPCARDDECWVLDLQSSRPDDFDPNDQMVYQSLADQISIAIENAKAYAVERQTVERLRELDRIQSQFLANMSHALRTPLTSIIGFSRMMLKELDGPITDVQHTDLDAIHHSGLELLGLINDMLELSQLDLGTAPFTLAKVDLTEIIEGVMATARALACGKPVQLCQEIPADLPVLYTDSRRVRQVILALVSNAVKFTDEGSILLRVIRENGHMTISVSDTGPGIPEPERARLFSNRSGETFSKLLLSTASSATSITRPRKVSSSGWSKACLASSRSR